MHCAAPRCGWQECSDLFDNDLQVVSLWRPDVIVLNIGSNDLCVPSQLPSIVENRILWLIDYLHYEMGVDRVVFNMIVYRRERPHRIRGEHDCVREGCLPLSVYNERVGDVNERLKAALYSRHFAIFWELRGLKYPQVDVYLEDGVHLNSTGNLRFYYLSISLYLMAYH